MDAEGRIRDQHRTGWVRLVEAQHSPTRTAAVVKVYDYPSLRDRRRGLLRNTYLAPSRARREAHNLDELARRQINPPLALAFGEHRTGGVLRQCFVATRWIPAANLAEWLSSAPDAADRQSCLTELGRFVGRLHAAGYADRDLHLRNIVRVDEHRLAKIDCSRGRFDSNLNRLQRRDRRELMEELTRCLRLPERQRVIRHYLRAIRPLPGTSNAASQAISRCRKRKSPAPR